MAQFETLLIDGGCATGVTRYADHYLGDQRNARIVVTIASIGGHAIPMIVDTGAPWCVLDPELTELRGLKPSVNQPYTSASSWWAASRLPCCHSRARLIAAHSSQ